MVNVTQGHIALGGGSSVSGDSAPPPVVDLGAANFRKDITAGLAQETTLVMNNLPEATTGFSAEQAPATLITNEVLGLSVDTFASGTSNHNQDVGLEQGIVLTMNGLPEKNAGFTQQHFLDYTGTKYVATATNIGTDSFTNPTNAQGVEDGSSASESGEALNARDAALRCEFESVGTKDSMTILTVSLDFFIQTTGTTLDNGDTRVWYRIGNSGGWTQLAQYTGNVNFLTTPANFDLTSVLTTWDDIRDVEAQVTHSSALAELYTTNVDAVRLNITAETGLI